MRSQTCCFTGHRVIPNSEIEQLTNRLSLEIINLIKRGYRYFGSGGALGFDMLAAEVVLSLKATYPHINLILVLPCRDQAKRWSKKDICKYETIKSRADKIVYITEKYFCGCMHTRNRHLVESSSICLCYYNGTGGGTYFTVSYATECNLEIINIADT